MKTRWIQIYLLVLTIFVFATVIFFIKNNPYDKQEQQGEVATAENETLTIGISSEPQGLDICRNTNISSMQIAQNYMETLVRYDYSSGKYQACLAERWEYRDDKTVRFFLRKDVVFHDGMNLTSEDVLFSLKRLVHSINAWIVSDINFSSTNIIDDYTLDIASLSYSENLFICLSDIRTSIASKNTLLLSFDDFYDRNPLGATGPYKFVEWIAGNRIVFERNEDYWGEMPYFERLVFRIIPDETMRTIAFESEEIDICFSPSASALERLRNNSLYTIIDCTSSSVWMVYFNTENDFLCEQNYRETMAQSIYSMDFKERLIDTFGNTVQIANTFLSPLNKECVHYSASDSINLKGSCLPPASIEILIPENHQSRLIAEIVRNIWGEIGIDCSIQELSVESLQDRYFKKQYDVILMETIYANPEIPYAFWQLNITENSFQSEKNKQEFQKIIAQLSGENTLDSTSSRMALMQLISKETLFTPICNSQFIYVARASLTGLNPSPNQTPLLTTVFPKT